MKFIVGGAFQGKLDYAAKEYKVNKCDIIKGEELTENMNVEGKCLTEYHLFIKKMLLENKDPLSITEQIIEKNPNIIIMNEIGSGIIPMEKQDRIWREQVGRVGCYLAENAETMERVICGIAVKLKG